MQNWGSAALARGLHGALARLRGEGPHAHVAQVRLHRARKQQAQHGLIDVVCSRGRWMGLQAVSEVRLRGQLPLAR